MVTGTIAGAAKLLNVSAPGISRLMKYSEDTLGVRLFNRTGGRYIPTPEARNIFDLLDNIYRKVEDLQYAIERLGKGGGQALSFASVPSIARVMVPRAVERLKRQFPELGLNMDILKIEDAVDYLLLGRGEVVAISSKFDHPFINFEPLADAKLVCIVPKDSPLAGRASISPAEIVEHPLIGIDPRDPYGKILTEVFRRNGLEFRMDITSRFGSSVSSLVASGLGVAVIDEFTVAAGEDHGVTCLPIEGGGDFHTYAAYRNDAVLSVHARSFIEMLRSEMKAFVSERREGQSG